MFKRKDHKGKLAIVTRWTNPGHHDGPVPSSEELNGCHGDLKNFAEEYLG